ncbi:hypothetical protein CLAFUW4_11306 [Fulvia fulva]|nr:hypothetical protein CLAFUR4_11312 [Fulvia fulva]WPV17414.1 hypothetical protein CLAFUW4_11306 [Fulvia fulva]WPV32219.1 hypothetical protein CLAFUW7_11302 [Fulvia fulva]
MPIAAIVGTTYQPAYWLTCHAVLCEDSAMFATYTPTRMKGTGVVQGLKSLAAKIHPQLPLNTKESNRLLTALTSSFRKHLDEAHPTAARPRVEHANDASTRHGGAGEPQSHSLHSSAAHADRHLASVLTNPLLAKGGQRFDYASAKRELIENPAKDPIQLLEEYHERNAATVRIAEVCLEHFMSGLTNMSAELRKAHILKSEPGRRVALWLLQNKVYEAANYIDNTLFQKLLVYFLHEEDKEQIVWDWISLDIRMPGSEGRTLRTKLKQELHNYRWRGRLLCALIYVKLGLLENRGSLPATNDRMHDALDVYFKACDLKLLGRQRKDHFEWTPLGAPAVALHRQLIQLPRPHPRVDLDVNRYNRFRDAIPLFLEGAPQIYFLAQYASLDLFHPRRQSPDRALQFWREILNDSPTASASAFVPRLKNGDGSAEIEQWFGLLARTVYVLQDEGRNQEASWLIGQALPLFPKQAPYMNKRLDEFRARDKTATSDQSQEHAVRVPFPTFV